MTHLTVETSPNRQRSSSSASSVPGDKPTPHSPDHGGEPSKSTPYAEVDAHPNTKKTFHLPLAPRSPGASTPSSPCIPDDPERQALLHPTETNRKRLAYPIILGIMAIVVLGFLLGVGGWGLSQGQGKDRWPGGP